MAANSLYNANGTMNYNATQVNPAYNANGTVNMYQQTGALGRLSAVPSYTPTAPVSGIPANNANGMNALQLGAAAQAERDAANQRNAERSAAILGGYEQQIGNSRALGDMGYQNLANNYAGIADDAAATRARNMERIDQYGNSLRSDLNIKSQQAISAAAQSAIKRGLGNTTIQDSAVRGANFDANRQRMNLEDQLLQNRISTDASLSKNYQDTLQARAQGLANQWNQNTATENSLTGRRLQFLEDINDQGPSFNDVGNYYMQASALQTSAPPAPTQHNYQIIGNKVVDTANLANGTGMLGLVRAPIQY